MDISSIKKAYRRYAPAYDFYFGLALSQGRRRVVEKMRCRPGDRVLEVGVGTGLSLPLYDPSVRIAGIDISPEMLERAHMLVQRRRLTNVEGLREMDAERMDFPDGSFDKVAAMYVVTVVPDPVRLVREMRRVCKPGGELFIVNHFQNPNPLIGACERLLTPLSRFLGFDPAFPMDGFLAQTGLSIVESCPVNFFGFWTMLRAVNAEAAEGEPMEESRLKERKASV